MRSTECFSLLPISGKKLIDLSVYRMQRAVVLPVILSTNSQIMKGSSSFTRHNSRIVFLSTQFLSCFRKDPLILLSLLHPGNFL